MFGGVEHYLGMAARFPGRASHEKLAQYALMHAIAY